MCPLFQFFQVQCRAVSRIRRNFFRLPPQIGSNLFQQRNHLMHVAAIVIETLRHDNLPVPIYGYLRVISLDEVVAALHQPAFRIR